MQKDLSQIVNQAVFRIMERVYGQTDLNTVFTEIHRTVTDLMEENRQLSGVSQQTGSQDFSGEIRNQVKPLLNDISDFAEVLSKELEDSEQRKKAVHILSLSHNLIRIVDEITIPQNSEAARGANRQNGSEAGEDPGNQEPLRAGVAEKKPRKVKVYKLPDVLIVEDNMVNIQLLMIYLRRYCNIFTIRDAKSAIEMAGQQKFDAIFMDIHLGAGMNGIEAMHEIRKIEGNENIPVIAVTGYASYGDREHFLKEGFTDYLKKPIEREMIKEVMDRLVSKQNS